MHHTAQKRIPPLELNIVQNSKGGALGTISLDVMVFLYCLLKSSRKHEAGPFPLNFKKKSHAVIFLCPPGFTTVTK